MGLMFDLISMGDSTVDLFLEIHEATVNCDLDPHECKLVLDYADKIPVTRLTRVAGAGNAANAAVGASRLGIKVALYTMIGDDSDGREMREIFRDEGVATDYVVTDSGKRSNLSAIINFRRERTILTYHEKREYHLPVLAETGWVYLTSLAEGFEPVHREIVEYVKKVGAKLVFQPGSYQRRAGEADLALVLKAAEVMIVNKREAQELLKNESEVIPELLKGLREWGPKTVVITDGERGSYSADGERVRWTGICPQTRFVERTGAGDAYATGLVAALIQGKDLGEAMRWGSANASAVVEYIGSREGLLRKEGMKERLKQCPLAEER